MTEHTSDGQRIIEDSDDVYTLAEWRSAVAAGAFNEYDGSGCWLKDTKFMTGRIFDDVFTTPPEGVTHVVWYNK
jgi:hypothetical protein